MGIEYKGNQGSRGKKTRPKEKRCFRPDRKS